MNNTNNAETHGTLSKNSLFWRLSESTFENKAVRTKAVVSRRCRRRRVDSENLDVHGRSILAPVLMRMTFAGQSQPFFKWKYPSLAPAILVFAMFAHCFIVHDVTNKQRPAQIREQTKKTVL